MSEPAAAAPAEIDVSILVVGYNSLPHLPACMASIPPAVTRHSFEVLFVNNGTDGSDRFLQQSFPATRLVPGGGNIGFAAGNNLLARKAGGRWLLVLNPDTVLSPQAIDVLLDVAKANPAYGILGGIMTSADERPNTLSIIEFPTLASIARGIVGRANRPIMLDPAAVIVDADVVCGGYMLVDRAAWSRLGGLDESFFLYSEEVDLCRRYLDLGGQIGIVPASLVFHDVGSGAVYSPSRMQFQMTGNAHYYRKHFGFFYARACLMLHWVSAIVRYVVGGILGRKRKIYAQMSAGFRRPALQPWTWMKGYDSPGADPRRK